MATTAVRLKVNQEHAARELDEAGRKLDGTEGEIVVDCSSMRRIDASVLRAMEEFAQRAQDKGVKVVLHGVNVDVYKVLKLVNLASRFSFANRDASGPATE